MIHVAAPLEEYARQMSTRHTAQPVGDGEASGTMMVIGGPSGGGSNFNVVPARTWFTVDGRFNPEEDIHAELGRITDIIDGAAARVSADVSIEVSQLAPSANPATDDRAAQLRDFSERTRSRDPLPAKMPGEGMTTAMVKGTSPDFSS